MGSANGNEKPKEEERIKISAKEQEKIEKKRENANDENFLNRRAGNSEYDKYKQNNAFFNKPSVKLDGYESYEDDNIDLNKSDASYIGFFIEGAVASEESDHGKDDIDIEKNEEYIIEEKIKLNAFTFKEKFKKVVETNIFFTYTNKQAEEIAVYSKDIFYLKQLNETFTKYNIPVEDHELFHRVLKDGAKLIFEFIKLDNEMSYILLKSFILFYANSEYEDIYNGQRDILKTIVERSQHYNYTKIDPDKLGKNFTSFIQFLIKMIFSLIVKVFLKSEDIYKILSKNEEVNGVTKSTFIDFIEEELEKINPYYDLESLVEICIQFIYQPIKEGKFIV